MAPAHTAISEDEEGVTPVVATLVLIIVAVIGAVSIAYLVGALSTDVSDYVRAPGATPTPGPQILIAGSPLTYPIDQQLSQGYMAGHRGVKISLQSSPDVYAGTTSLSMNISDIVSLPGAPDSALLFKDPKIRPHFIGGQAVVAIAHEDMNIPALSRSDLSVAYGLTPGSIPVNLTGLAMVVRNGDGRGCERTFAGWLTDGTASGLDGYVSVPPGVQNYTASGDADAIAKVSSTPGAIGFVSWASVASNDPSVSHLKVIPIVNANNRMVQMPAEGAIKGEMARMDNANYDAGLVWGVYYLTEGEPRPVVQEYIDWCQTPEAARRLRDMGMYGAAEVGNGIT